jgi:sugar phosphate isomerase/epimerase
MLLDRGLMGEGCIPVKQIRSWVEAAGFTGFNEVEIFLQPTGKKTNLSIFGRLLKHTKKILKNRADNS